MPSEKFRRYFRRLRHVLEPVGTVSFVPNKATMYGIAPLSAEGKLSAIGGLGRLGGAEKDIGNAVRDWSAGNPNAAETVEAAFNVATVTKAAKLAKTGTGKAAVSEDFADAYHADAARQMTTETEALRRIGDNQRNNTYRNLDNRNKYDAKYTDILSKEEKQHILYGDKTGGGHLYPSKNGKTAFPQHWSANKVSHEVGDIVTSPTTQWYAQTGSGGKYTSSGKPARWVSYETRDGIRIRTVYEPATGKVITAFPDKTSKPTYKQIK